ncbi:MAG: hypothetical protein U0169_26135 [Polyangiaceae bacterium]
MFRARHRPWHLVSCAFIVAISTASCKSKDETSKATNGPDPSPTVTLVLPDAAVPELPDPVDQSKLAEFLPEPLDGWRADAKGGRDEKTQTGIRFVFVERVYHAKDDRHYTVNVVDGRTYKPFYSVGTDPVVPGYTGSRDAEPDRKRSGSAWWSAIASS